MNLRRLASCTLTASLIFAASGALAQEEGPTDAASVAPADDEEEEGEEEEDKKLEMGFLLTSEVHTMNNLDYRQLDETSDESILESDDRATFAYTGISGELEYEVIEDVEFDLALSHTGMWGDDQLGGLSGGQPMEAENAPLANRSTHFLWIYRLSATWEAIETEGFELEATIGRQDFEIGGAEDDFFFDDTIDGVTIEMDMDKGGKVRLLPLDFYGSNATPESVDFVDYISRRPAIMGFRGDTNVMRFGGVYQNTELVDGLDLRAFGFYSDIGASTRGGSTGSDRTIHGSLGNFSDHDFSWMAGTRAGYTWEGSGGFEIGGFGEYARSGGVDRKDREIGLRDVNNDGNAYGAGIHTSYGTKEDFFGIDARVRWFHADGGIYTGKGGSGTQSSHGFVSMKGDEIGGINLNRYAGFHPSAYVGGDGVMDMPNNISRKSGTELIQGAVGLDFSEYFHTELKAAYMWDTSTAFIKPGQIDDIATDLPFGYTEADLEAQARFGKPLGTELNLSLQYKPNKPLSFYALGGAFLPGAFYETKIDRNVSGRFTALGSDSPQPFWVVAGGTTLKF